MSDHVSKINNDLMLINQFQLPFEILNIIKGFRFYEFKEFLILQQVKKFKKELISLLSNAMSRANPFYIGQLLIFENNNIYEEIWDESGEEWSFCVQFNDMNATFFQATNCKKCGNYKESITLEIIPNKIACNCL